MTRLFFLLSLLFLVGCETVPITNRQQVSLISDDEITTMAAREFRSFVKESDVITGTSDARLVQSVGKKIRAAVDAYFSSHGDAARLKSYRWEFVLVESDEINAFCMPGGKVAVYTGILPVAKNEAGLAVVMGHEIAHAIANHGNERMSQSMLVDAAGEALEIMLLDSDDPLLAGAFEVAFGLGSEVGVLLPFSRLHESEADHLGLIFMSMAGYDPHEAPKFWRRMAAATGNDDGALEFLSTHPSDETRIKELEEKIPEAMSYYKKSTKR